MQSATTIIIGAGQAGLAMSHNLSERSIDHVLLERGEVANSWRRAWAAAPMSPSKSTRPSRTTIATGCERYSTSTGGVVSESLSQTSWSLML